MPGTVNLLNANALTHASVFCCGSARVYVDKNALIIVAWGIQQGCADRSFFLPCDAPIFFQWLEYVNLLFSPRKNRLRSYAVE